jgi:molecular chaperone Hsp33
VSQTAKTAGDQILRSLIGAGRARVVAVTATAAVREMARRHDIFGLPAVALGRAAVAGLLLATLTKDEEQVTLQVLGDGPLGGVTVDARSSGRVRGFVKHPGAVPWLAGVASAGRLAVGAAIGSHGVVSVIRDLGMAQNYSGQVQLQSGEIDEEVERYLNTSEQIDSVLRCDTLIDETGAVSAAAGLLVQTLPQAHGAALVELVRDSLRDAAFSGLVKQGLGREDWGPVAIAQVALGPLADDLQLLDQRAISFFCPCSRERAETTLGMLRAEDLQQMILENNEADVTCNFCGSHYRFSEIDLEKLRRKGEPAQAKN